MASNQGQEKKGQKKERTHAQAKVELFAEVEKAKALLIESENEQAIEDAQRAIIDLKEDLGGESSVLLLPGYFILAEAYIALGKLKKAEEFLIAAYWNFSKYNKKLEKREEQFGQDDKRNNNEGEYITEDEAVLYRATLHKTFSKLFLGQKEYVKALDELKNGIYMDSMKYGPEHIITSINYFSMGNIFLQKKQIAEGEAFYGKTAEIWYNYFKAYFKKIDMQQEGNNDSNNNPDDMLVKEACDILQTILTHFEERYQDEERKAVFVPLLNSNRALALIFKYADEETSYKRFINSSYQECLRVKGPNHKKTKKLLEMLDMTKDYQD